MRNPQRLLANLAAMATLLATASTVQAHLLLARYTPLSDHKIRIESFYSTSSPAVKAVVRVYRPDGELLLEPGETNESGIYEFSRTTAEELKVVVSQEGHRKELIIPLAAAPVPDVSDRPHIAEILAGLSFILAAAALYLSARTASRLKRELTTNTQRDTKK